jgi:ribonuclease R
MKELADIVRKAKDERGYIDFDTDEAKVIVDEKGVPYDVVLRDKGPGQLLIEDFMIKANECVATHIFFMDLPFIYRVHEYPKEDKIRNFLGFVSSLGYSVPSNVKDLSPKSMQILLNFLRDKKEYKVLSSQLLRNMQKAVYLPQNLGHYGLASKFYTHFTSPIRRYPDLFIHRVISAYLKGELDEKSISKFKKQAPKYALISSDTERQAEEAERDLEQIKMCEYMAEKVNEEYDGIISSVTNFGVFVELSNTIEGLVHVENMKDDYYNYDEANCILEGERTHKIYKIGDKVKVKVLGANKLTRRIDFEIV